MNTSPLLTDFYQFTMAYALWKANKVNDVCTFELFFRKNPFHGEFTIFGGLEDALKFIQTFSYNENDIDFLRKKMPEYIEQEFFNYLKNINTRDLTVYAIREGTVVFPKVPLMIITGPIIIVQLLETTLLNLINFASLMTTNAARHRLVAGRKMKLMEFGLRRAQGPNGALSASKYSYIGGFDATSNVLAGQLFNIPICGTHAHSFIMSFSSVTDINQNYELPFANDKTKTCDFSTLTYHYSKMLRSKINIRGSESNQSELKAMMSYAVAYPHCFFALVDTYDVLRSGLPNFAAVSIALYKIGYKPLGIRIDSGDLAYLSCKARQFFKKVDEVFEIDCFTNLQIMASNDITEEIIMSLAEQNHEITAFGIGTNLVTCFKQPALGCVYKLVELNNEPKMKLTQDYCKVTIPGKKFAYRLMGSKNEALVDLMLGVQEIPPVAGVKILCQHPFKAAKRVYVTPKDVIPLHQLYFKNGEIVSELPSLKQIREFVNDNLEIIRTDIKRYLNPTPYKVSISSQLYEYMHTLWLKNTLIDELN